jgi:AcrR family transcriptional regulator
MASPAGEPARKEQGVSSTSLTSEKPSGPRSRKGIETRARLVSAAKEIFERDGFLDARISDIAERAGLSHGSFYHYFESKEEVFREVALEVDERLNTPMQDVIFDRAFPASTYERLRTAIRMHLEIYKEEARIMRVIEQVSRIDPQVSAARSDRHVASNEDVTKAIEALQRQGLADPRIDPTIAAAALGSMTYRFPEMWLVQGLLDTDFETVVDQMTLLFVNALGLDSSEAGADPRRG